MDEKRGNPRFECDDMSACAVEFPGIDSLGYLSNLSRTGLAFSLPLQLRNDAVYKFDIRPNNSDRKIPCEARGVWVNTDEATQMCLCGARIVDMDPGEKSDLIDQLYEGWKKRLVGSREV
jgi:hypothetical protein